MFESVDKFAANTEGKEWSECVSTNVGATTEVAPWARRSPDGPSRYYFNLVARLIELRVPLFEFDDRGHGLLAHAASVGAKRIVKLAMRELQEIRGVDLSELLRDRNPKGETPLHAVAGALCALRGPTSTPLPTPPPFPSLAPTHSIPQARPRFSASAR